jgi:hypothetical protein
MQRRGRGADERRPHAANGPSSRPVSRRGRSGSARREAVRMDAVSGGVAVTGQREWNTAGAIQRYDDIAPAHRLGLDTAAWMPPLKPAGCRLAAEGSAAPLAAAAAHSGGDALDSALGGGGSRGRGECRIAGGGEGEGGESMPDAETSPLPPDEPPAEISIEG